MEAEKCGQCREMSERWIEKKRFKGKNELADLDRYDLQRQRIACRPSSRRPLGSIRSMRAWERSGVGSRAQAGGRSCRTMWSSGGTRKTNIYKGKWCSFQILIRLNVDIVESCFAWLFICMPFLVNDPFIYDIFKVIEMDNLMKSEFLVK